jgi:HD-like signal output (HDOD) protein
MLNYAASTKTGAFPPNRSPQAIRKALADVPAFRPVAVQLLRLVRAEEPEFRKIIALLRTDAVITAQVVRLANSPLFATRCTIKNELQAVSLLGLERLSSLLITTSLRSLSAIIPAQVSRMCWRHNLGTAIVARLLSSAAGLAPDQCYVAGLIHDIGSLAMLRVFPSYETAQAEAHQRGVDLVTAESELFGIDHTEAGRWLLEHWDCPKDLQLVAAGHERPWEAVSGQQLLFVIHAASLLADRMKLSMFANENTPELEHIAEILPPKAAEQVMTTYPDLEERVALNVNEVELMLA